MSGRDRTLLVAVVALWAALTIPFAGTAFRIDEPTIIAIAKQIDRSPSDPYGFTINWTGQPRPAFEVLANPPLLPAWLAIWSRAFGWSEVSLHVAVLPFSLVLLLAMAFLARRFAIEAPLGALALLCSPAFVLGSHVVMPDVAMLAAVTASVLFALRFSEEGGAIAFAVAAIAGAAAPLLKYNGLIVIPMIVAIALLGKTRRVSTFLIALAPAASIAAWSVVSAMRYGEAHILAIRRFESGANVNPFTGALAAIGLAVVPLAFVAGGSFSSIAPGLRAAVIGVALGGGALIGWTYDYPWVAIILLSVALAIAVRVTLLAIDSAVASRRSPVVPALPAVWLALVLLSQSGLLFSSVRYALPALPAIILLLASGQRTRWWPALCVTSVALCLVLALSDARVANGYRSAVRSAVDLKRPQEKFLVAGHWGLQYYAELAGAREVGRDDPGTFDDLVIESKAAFPAQLTHGEIAGTYEIRSWSSLQTIGCGAAANFYGNAVANCGYYPILLPFGIAATPSDVVTAERR